MPAALVLLASVLPENLQAALAWERQAIDAGEWWRLWTGQLVHFGAFHALANGAALWLFGTSTLSSLPGLASGYLGRRAGLAALVLMVAPPLLSLSLLLWSPAMGAYRGASGLVAMLLAGVATSALITGSRRLISGVLLAAWVVKILLEALGVSLMSSLPGGVVVAWPVHAVGGLLGVAWALAASRPYLQSGVRGDVRA